ncbi:conserved hypothetical protein [Vibrio nigripulchritudo MADA3029]|nr:conserved hypothetical protein [Vibrio nigripulchritudo MADA3020]CCN55834.1 conserved hypothetical protein [Vibrio nigripulchritudo MADA3021]CCN57058.1 conserved hypothetical protein [Vibrio nigripulchritudo MADA3029]
MFKKLLCASLFALSTSSFAQGWTESLTVESVFTEGTTDIIVIQTSGGSVYTNSCLANLWIFKSDTDARRGRAYSTAMSALVSGKKIRLWYTDSCESWSYHGATSIKLMK